VTSSLPLAEAIGQDDATYTTDDEALRRIAEDRSAHVTVATPGYFEALGLVIREGRGFTDTDDSRGIPVALVSAALARESFSGRNPIGRRITVGFGGPPVAREIVGVVGDIRQTGLATNPGPAIFLPHAQAPTGALTFTIRTASDPALLLDRVKAELWTINRAMPIATTTTLDALLSETLRERQFLLVLLVTFGAVALLLAGIGVYGVLGHAVRERRKEFGVRLALGGSTTHVMVLVLLQGARLAFAGVVVGLLLAAGGARLLSVMLYRVTPLDAATFAASTLFVLVVAALAACVPGRRAAKLDPIAALRDE
jgi:putative ABC transport system permease protein